MPGVLFSDFCARSSTEILAKVVPQLGFTLVNTDMCYDQAKPSSSSKRAPTYQWYEMATMRELGNALAVMNAQQRVSKFPNAQEVASKTDLNKILRRSARLSSFPREHLAPISFDYPEEADAVEREVTEGEAKGKVWIVKPTSGAHGDGIFLARTMNEIRAGVLNIKEACVVQEYLIDPLLVDGLKFDLRLYVLVVSVDPPEAYLCKEGLARFCTEPYARPDASNIRKAFMHLTNYSLNKASDKFVHAESEDCDEGSKRTLRNVLAAIHNGETIWNSVVGLVQETISAISVPLASHYRSLFPLDHNENLSRCFQIFGLDVLITSDGKPWLLEINSNPSLRLDYEKTSPNGVIDRVPSPLDILIKEPMLLEALRLVESKRTKKAIGNISENYQELSCHSCNCFHRCLDLYQSLVGASKGQGLSSGKFSSFGKKLSLSSMKNPDWDIVYVTIMRKSKKNLMGAMEFIDALILIAQKSMQSTIVQEEIENILAKSAKLKITF